MRSTKGSGQALPSGMLLVYKPKGMVSKDVSRRIESLYGRQKIGHTGTLDPLAEGVLPILLGRATRLQDLLVGVEKEYIFDIAFGEETDTLDAAGEVVKRADIPSGDGEELSRLIESFVGSIEQVPPLYSAIKYKGRPLYDYMRKGEQDKISFLDLKRQVHISSLSVLNYTPQTASFRVTCSKGTYVRSLARDIAYGLSSCATVTRLVRSRCSGFSMEQAHSMEALERGFEEASSLVIPIEKLPLSVFRWYDEEGGILPKLWMGQKVSVDKRRFVTGFKEQAVISLSHANLILVNNQNRVLGIGESCEDMAGRVRLSLKRGLV